VTVLADDIIALAYGEAYRPAGRILAVLIWAIPLALLSGHYRYVLIACDHERLDFRSNAIGAASAAVLGALSIPWQGAVSAAVALVAAAFVILLIAHAATRERGVVLASIARVLPACSAVVASGLAARSV